MKAIETKAYPYIGIGLGVAGVFLPPGIITGILGVIGLWAVWHLMRS